MTTTCERSAGTPPLQCNASMVLGQRHPTTVTFPGKYQRRTSGGLYEDEVHCTIVPVLRHYSIRLQVTVRSAYTLHRRHRLAHNGTYWDGRQPFHTIFSAMRLQFNVHPHEPTNTLKSEIRKERKYAVSVPAWKGHERQGTPRNAYVTQHAP